MEAILSQILPPEKLFWACPVTSSCLTVSSHFQDKYEVRRKSDFFSSLIYQFPIMGQNLGSQDPPHKKITNFYRGVYSSKNLLTSLLHMCKQVQTCPNLHLVFWACAVKLWPLLVVSKLKDQIWSRI